MNKETLAKDMTQEREAKKSAFSVPTDLYETRNPASLYSQKMPWIIKKPKGNVELKTDIVNQTKVTYRVVNPSLKTAPATFIIKPSGSSKYQPASSTQPTKQVNGDEVFTVKKSEPVSNGVACEIKEQKDETNLYVNGVNTTKSVKGDLPKTSKTQNKHVLKPETKEMSNAERQERFIPGSVSRFSALFENLSTDDVKNENDNSGNSLQSYDIGKSCSVNKTVLSDVTESYEHVTKDASLDSGDHYRPQSIISTEQLIQSPVHKATYELGSVHPPSQATDEIPSAKRVNNSFVKSHLNDNIHPKNVTFDNQKEKLSVGDAHARSSLYTNDYVGNKEFGQIPTRRPVVEDMFDCGGWVTVGQVTSEVDNDGDEMSTTSGTSEVCHSSLQFHLNLRYENLSCYYDVGHSA